MVTTLKISNRPADTNYAYFFCSNLLFIAGTIWRAEETPEPVCWTNGPITCQCANVSLSIAALVLRRVVRRQKSHPFAHSCVLLAFKCDLPPADGEVVVKGMPENEQAILPDRFLRFSCEAPGKYLNGSSMLICGKNGVWDHPFPTCEGGS